MNELMNQQFSTQAVRKKGKMGLINNVDLIIFAFSSVFFSRIIIITIRAPSFLNLLHFIIVPFVLGVVLFTARTREYRQIKLAQSLLLALFILFMVTVASALLNDAGLINAIVSFMILAEPFMLLLAIISTPMTAASVKKLWNFLLGSAFVNFILAAFQKPMIESGRLNGHGLNGTDGCGGVFYPTGAGNYVSCSLSIVFALYFFTSGKDKPLWMRFAAIVAALWQLLFSDSKQILLVLLIGWLLLIISNFQDIGKSLQFLSGLALFAVMFFWAAENIEVFSTYLVWVRPELYGSDGVAWYSKFAGIRGVISYYQSPLNWFLGLGPGHTVSRLGGWFLRDYRSLLEPLGSTIHPLSAEMMTFLTTFWLATSSSLFSPIFSWAGIWGDLGLLGLAAYLYLDFLVWRYLCTDQFLKFIALSTVCLGLIFTQMEEPGYMLSIAMMIGISWQHSRQLHL